MDTRRRLSRSVAVVAAGGLAVLTVAAVSQPASAATRHRVIRGSASDWTRSAHRLGRSPAHEQVGFGVLLRMRDHAGAVRTLQRISEPQSPEYGNWFSTAQFKHRYAPAPADVSAVKGWLRSAGFTVDKVFPSGMYIKASGTIAQLDQTFDLALHKYRYKGMTLRGNPRDVTLPAGTPSTVVGVTGLDNTAYLKKPATKAAKLPGPPPGARYGVQPCSYYDGQKLARSKPRTYGRHWPYVICGYTPTQYQRAYGLSGLLRRGINGHGATIAITDAYAAPTIRKDARIYNRVYHQRRFRRGQFRQVLPDHFNQIQACGAQGWYGEETLDVEAAHAMAPGANVVYVAGANCGTGLDDAWAMTIEKHLADVITNSWSYGTEDLPSSLIQFYDQYALQAALTGMTDNFSSGDSGDEVAATGKKQVGIPASDPYVSGIGGTSVGIGRHGRYRWEHGWQNAYVQLKDHKWSPKPPGPYSSGGGGGTSRIFDQPFYQKGKVPTEISEYFTSTPHRAVPDISMPGDPNTGLVVGETQKFPNGTYWDTYRIGGTSLSSPLMAGVVAVADQYAGHSLGFVNPLYYRMLGTRAVHDVRSPARPLARVRTDYTNHLNNEQGKMYMLQTIDAQSTTIHTLRRYDDETGVGTPRGSSFVYFARRWNRT